MQIFVLGTDAIRQGVDVYVLDPAAFCKITTILRCGWIRISIHLLSFKNIA